MTDSAGQGAGDQGVALAELVERHGRRCFGAAMGILRDAGAAEDACQQAALKAWDRRQELDRLDNPGAWLLRVVINESLQVLRRRKTERQVLRRIGTDEAAASSASDGLGLREAVLDAIGRLEEPTRTIVVLRIIEGRTGNEVVDMLGCSASEVSRRMHDGMQRLRPMLSEWRDLVGR